MKLDYIELESLLVNTVEIAGEVIMQYYNNDNMNIQLKKDNSPVTSAGYNQSIINNWYSHIK